MDNTKVAILAILLLGMFSIFASGFWNVKASEMLIASSAVSGLTGFIGGWAYARATEKPIPAPIEENKNVLPS